MNSPARVLAQWLRRLGQWTLRQPRLKQAALWLLHRAPWLKRRLRGVLLEGGPLGDAAALSPRAGRILERLRHASRADAVRRPGASAEHPPAASPRRPRLAFVSPLPPARSGIANYSLELLPHLAAHYDVELVTDQAQVELAQPMSAWPRRSIAWFVVNGQEYERIVYQLANNPWHVWMFELQRLHPGVVVLHDFFLSSVLSYQEATGLAPGAWTEALHHSHGYLAMRQRHGQGDAAAREAWPCNLEVMQNARGVIVHSQFARSLAARWHGDAALACVRMVPHLREAVPPPDTASRSAARQALGLAADAFVVCSFGFVHATKLSQRLLRAWASSPLAADPRCQLVFVGANDDGAYGAEFAQDLAGQPRARITGWAEDAVYRQYLEAADLAVQLRAQSRGESSGAVLHAMNHGVPLIANAHGAMAELPGEAAYLLADEFTGEELAAALAALWRDAARRARMGEAGRQAVLARHDPGACATLYAQAIEAAWADDAHEAGVVDAAIRAAPLPRKERELRRLAVELAARTSPRPRCRQLMVDVSSIIHADARTGIERVVRAELLALLQADGANGGNGSGNRNAWRVQPVYQSWIGGECHYRHAHGFACALLGVPWNGLPEAPVDVCAGDVFYALDFAPSAWMQAARAGVFARWRARGVRTCARVYDLLPVLRPEFFPAENDAHHAAWLAEVAAHADGALAISQAVAAELREWLARHASGAVPQVQAVPLGADIAASSPTTGLPPDAPGLLAQWERADTFLMVGTIEPRKGHLQVLDAFERLWSEGSPACLVVVGRAGWGSLPPAQRRTIPAIVARLRGHAERGRRLWWIEDASDEYLQRLYAACTCLIAASEGEGFGLPLIEAARAGLPILARDIAVFREVAGTHASYFAAASGADLAAAITRWLAEHHAAGAPASQGMAWNTWAQTAQGVLQVVDALCAQGGPGTPGASPTGLGKAPA